jgi:hypothetical protein
MAIFFLLLKNAVCDVNREGWKVVNFISFQLVTSVSKTVLSVSDYGLHLDTFSYIQLRLVLTCRSQWPRGLSHELSSPAQTLGSWARIPLEARMSVCFYSVFVLSCVQVAALRRAHPPSKECYRLCKKSRNWKSSQGPTKDCRAIDRQTYRQADRQIDR